MTADSPIDAGPAQVPEKIWQMNVEEEAAKKKM
jgi:hypothetical protein